MNDVEQVSGTTPSGGRLLRFADYAMRERTAGSAEPAIGRDAVAMRRPLSARDVAHRVRMLAHLRDAAARAGSLEPV